MGRSVVKLPEYVSKEEEVTGAVTANSADG
jgi:hypothetical protein